MRMRQPLQFSRLLMSCLNKLGTSVHHLVLLVLLLFSGTGMLSAQLNNLVIVEYVDANGGDGLMIKIFNPTGAAIDLSGYSVAVWNNAANNASWCEPLTGTIPAGGTILIRNDTYTACPTADISLTGRSGVNGDDVVALLLGACTRTILPTPVPASGPVRSAVTFVDYVGSFGVTVGTPNQSTVGGTANGTQRRKIIRAATNCQRYTVSNNSNFTSTNGLLNAGWATSAADNMAGWTSVTDVCLTNGIGGAGQFAGFPTTTAAPTGVTLVDRACTSMRATWTPAGDAEYIIEASAVADFATLLPTYPLTLPVGANSHIITGLTPGTRYFFRIRSRRCDALSPFVTVDDLTTTTITVGVSPDVSICGGVPPGAPLTATGATTYAWTPAAGLSATTGASVNALPAGTTTYTVTGTSGACTGSAAVTVTIRTGPTFPRMPAATLCDGVASPLCLPGCVPGGDCVIETWREIPNPTGGAATIVVTNGCCANVATTDSRHDLIVRIRCTSTGCVREDTFRVSRATTPAISAPLSPFTFCSAVPTRLSVTSLADAFSWNPPTDLDSPTAPDPLATVVTTTVPVTRTYTVTATNRGTCTNSTTVTITVNPAPAVTASPNVTICDGASTTLTGGPVGITYSWTPAGSLSSSTSRTPTASPTTTTTYTLRGFTGGGCTGTAAVTVTVTPATVDAGTDVTICEGQSTTLGATGATTYSWGPAAGLSATNIANPVASPTTTTT
jgi:hypothetical protein